MKFNRRQYDAAIEALEYGREQLEPDSRPCAICEDTGHQAWECGRNPLFAMFLCERIAEQSSVLHATLHKLAGCETHMGEVTGPARVVMPS